uniref:Protein FAM210A n=1 Tax=Castor canadensis TaxID=51338 RepID=A0A8C0ZN95_CASCN
MQWNVPRSVSRLAHRTCLEPQKAGLFGHRQNLQGSLLLYSAESKVVWVPCSQKQGLHLPASQCLAKEWKPLDAQPAQPGVLRYKPWEQDALSKRVLSSSATSQGTPSEKKEEPEPLQDKSMSLYQRFKKTSRQYGKVLIPVHLVTSGVWFGTFYCAAIKGVNVIPFLELVGSSDSVVNILKNSQSGNALTAYAMFKIATPACYTVTLGGTSFTATCQGVSTGQDGRDQGAHHRENGRDKG